MDDLLSITGDKLQCHNWPGIVYYVLWVSSNTDITDQEYVFSVLYVK